MFGLKVTAYLITLILVISELDIFTSAANYVRFPHREGNGISTGFGMVNSLSRRRNARRGIHDNDANEDAIQGSYYPFARRSAEDVQLPEYSISLTESDLKCATLEACLGGVEASEVNERAEEILSRTNLSMMDHLLLPAFRHGYFSKSKDYCRQIYSDCVTTTNTKSNTNNL